MTPTSHICWSDGRVFPPVTPDPPLPPAGPEIKVPDIVPVSPRTGPRRGDDPRDDDATSETAGVADPEE